MDTWKIEETESVEPDAHQPGIQQEPFDIDTDIVWKTVSEEIPDLLPKLRMIVK